MIDNDIFRNESSKLDFVKTSLSVSMRTKNDLKKLKGGLSYDDYIRSLIRNQSKTGSFNNSNMISYEKFERRKELFRENDLQILFSYNEFKDSQNFRFDIKIETVRIDGKEISIKDYVSKDYNHYGHYFQMLEIAIRKEIEPMFNFKKYGRNDYMDYLAWKHNFTLLGLSNKAFEEDVMEKMNDYLKGSEHKFKINIAD
jgi:hypothetical protein